MRGFSKSQVFGFFLTGAAVGAVIALLYAPKSGVETRKQVRKFSKKTVHQLDDLQNDFREQISDGYQQVMEVFDNAKEYVQEGRDKVRKMLRTA